jgi:hypothetical protein
MNKIEKKYFTKYPYTRVTLIDNINKNSWPAWKMYKDCNDIELKEANLREIFPNELVIDIEHKDTIELKKTLVDNKLRYLLFDSGSRGTHTHIFFYNLDSYSKDVRKDVRKIMIKKFNADESKASETTLIAMFDKPHFKTMKNKELIEDASGEDLEQPLPKEPILQLREAFFKKEDVITPTTVVDELFKNYHTTDNFFKFIESNIIPDNTNRDTTVFPNLAIALVKEGLTEVEIRALMEPIIKKNFPGKTYSEFYGWVKKAFTKQIDTYNTIQLNTWVQTHFSIPPIYDNRPIELQELMPNNNTNEKVFFSLEEFENMEIPEMQWLVENWLPAGNICYIAGMLSSYKSSICMHIALAVSQNKLVFNKYKVIQGNVLYLNEENSLSDISQIIKRIKKGHDIDTSSKNIFLSNEVGFSTDKSQDIQKIISFIKEKDIKLVVFDSFRRFFSGDENSATDMAKTFEVLKYIRKESGHPTLLLIHHLKKEMSNFKTDPREMMRGTSDIGNSADSIIAVIRPHRKNYFSIAHTKIRGKFENTPVKIVVDAGENNDKAYFYEITEDTNEVLTEPEQCENAIIQVLESNGLETFKRDSLLNYQEIINFKDKTITRALTNLVFTGTLSKIGDSNRNMYYKYNKFTQVAL